jgi:hypothetical protein
VADALDPYLRDRSTREPAEHHAPQAIAYGVAEAPGQRLGDERPALALFFFHPETGRCYVQHRQKTTC